MGAARPAHRYNRALAENRIQIMLQFDNVSLRRGPRLLFECASFQIHPGQKAGLTGANGTGHLTEAIGYRRLDRK